MRHADLNVVEDGGRFVETGTHESLIARSGRYRRLYELQFRTPDSNPIPHAPP